MAQNYPVNLLIGLFANSHFFTDNTLFTVIQLNKLSNATYNVF